MERSEQKLFPVDPQTARSQGTAPPDFLSGAGRFQIQGRSAPSVEAPVERFDWGTYWPQALCGAVGGILYILFPIFFRTSTQTGVLGMTWVTWAVVILAGAVGGFVALISKNPKLWGAFVLGITFPSIVGNLVAGSTGTPAPEERKVEQEIEDTWGLLEPLNQPQREPAWGVEEPLWFEFFPRAYADVQDHGVAADSTQLTQALEVLRHSASAQHLGFLEAALGEKGYVAFRLSSKAPVELKVQIFYGSNKVTTFTLAEGFTQLVIPRVSEPRVVKVSGPGFHTTAQRLPAHLTHLELEWSTSVSAGVKSAFGQSPEALYLPKFWIFNKTERSPPERDLDIRAALKDLP